MKHRWPVSLSDGEEPLWVADKTCLDVCPANANGFAPGRFMARLHDEAGGDK